MTPPPQSLPLIVGAVVGGFVLLGVLRYCIIWYRRKVDNQIPSISEDGISRPKPQPDEPKSDPTPTPSTGHPIALSQIIFSYEQLAIATNGFSENNFIGEGGFGHVHKGVLPNEKVVAVKQLKLESKQGEREFRAEVEVISRIHHKHLVSLVGYCISGEQRLLVYEFVPNGNLEYHLHGLESPTMNWPTRLKIAIGSAKGLAYLHEDCQPKIIHRDIKAANILLDSNFEAKVSDFGLAKFLLDTVTHITTRVMGTFGYLAPEYASSGQLTDKSDVFSFGVVLLELITGLRPFDKTQSFPNDSLVEWGRPLLAQALEHGNFEAIVDPRLQNDYEPTELARMVACAAACVRHMARSRPRISQIVRALEGYLSLDDLNEEISLGTAGNIDYGNDQYKEDLKKFRKMVPISHDQGSSECSGPSTDSALHQSVSSSES
ncbi:proline-rich receptor-like protein kinase PERK1 isoform X2 [Quercus suber]|uniref:proline-rich receptor-like protein kinase PERK1 isoform X2 n=1 Tax=Quercus suber TaxID=58331 RepID=UPI000CE2292C|nr:proline-rich receptor-like protein kinase PERK1 [Quercus suber]